MQQTLMQILSKSGEHLYISFISVLFGIVVAVPLGIILTRYKKTSSFIIGVASFLQTIPSLALLSIMIPFFGIGRRTAIIALFIYSLLPILRNTYTGILSVDEKYIDSAEGMGMSNLQILYYVQLPLSFSVILSGIRLSTVFVISWTTLAAYIGGGGLGDFIFTGLTLYKPSLILMGVIPVTILALVTDIVLRSVQSRYMEKI
ncbi:ABC transporter permease [Streptococcus suis]|nr:ABC transporter permease [Streptococcus suis]